jgi:hypothetical protein
VGRKTQCSKGEEGRSWVFLRKWKIALSLDHDKQRGEGRRKSYATP